MIIRLIRLIIRRFKLINKRFGLIPALLDDRDYQYEPVGITKNSVNLFNDDDNAIVNQGHYNSCVAHAAGHVLESFLKKETQSMSINWKQFDVSEAFIWAMTRHEEGTLNKNVGVVLRDAFKSIKKYGFVSENHWNFKDGAYVFPPIDVMQLAHMHTFLLKYLPAYYTINRYATYKIDYIKNAMSNGSKVVLALPVFDNFVDYNSGIITEFVGDLHGYHAVVLGDYEVIEGVTVFTGRNTWGSRWGEDGYFRITDEVIRTNSFDIWTLMKKEEVV